MNTNTSTWCAAAAALFLLQPGNAQQSSNSSDAFSRSTRAVPDLKCGPAISGGYQPGNYPVCLPQLTTRRIPSRRRRQDAPLDLLTRAGHVRVRDRFVSRTPQGALSVGCLGNTATSQGGTQQYPIPAPNNPNAFCDNATCSADVIRSTGPPAMAII